MGQTFIVVSPPPVLSMKSVSLINIFSLFFILFIIGDKGSILIILSESILIGSLIEFLSENFSLDGIVLPN